MCNRKASIGDVDETMSHIISQCSNIEKRFWRLGTTEKKGDSLRIMQEIKSGPYYQMVSTQTRMYLRK